MRRARTKKATAYDSRGVLGHNQVNKARSRPSREGEAGEKLREKEREGTSR